MGYAEVSSMRTYREALSHLSPLTREAERELAARWNAGDERAGAELVQACLPFVVSIAFEYRRWGVPIEDVVQEGNIGLLRAAKKFDLARECRLATYAAYWIRAEIREYVVRAYRVVRLGTTKSERRALRMYRTARVTDAESLAKASGVSAERMDQLFPLLAARETSLDANTNGTLSVQERTASKAASPEDEAAANEARVLAKEAVRGALDVLSDRERFIVEQRLMTDEPVTLAELGEHLGVSKERVRQLEERARTKLRSKLGELRELALAM